ncbi:hypothetical protein [Kitasatospora sp. NPDC004272]
MPNPCPSGPPRTSGPAGSGTTPAPGTRPAATPAVTAATAVTAVTAVTAGAAKPGTATAKPRTVAVTHRQGSRVLTRADVTGGGGEVLAAATALILIRPVPAGPDAGPEAGPVS